LSPVHHFSHVSAHCGFYQGLTLRIKINRIHRGCAQDKVDLLVNSYLLSKEVTMLCNNIEFSEKFRMYEHHQGSRVVDVYKWHRQ